MVFDDHLVTEIRSDLNSNLDLESTMAGEKIVAIDCEGFQLVGTFVKNVTQEGWPFSPFNYGVRYPRARNEQKHE